MFGNVGKWLEVDACDEKFVFVEWRGHTESLVLGIDPMGIEGDRVLVDAKKLVQRR